MNELIELNKTTKLVESILRTNKQSRNSDSFLYLQVLRHHSEGSGINLQRISVSDFLLNRDRYGFPPFESVRRARQKVQAKFPELSASDKVSYFREENERDYRSFAKSDLGWQQ